MTNLLPLLKERTSRKIENILYTAGQCAHKCDCRIYAAGALVRDLLLDRKRDDIFLLIDGSVLSFARDLQKYLPGRLEVYEKLGTAAFFLQSGATLKMTTLRREFSLQPSTALSEEEVLLKKELFNSDFTINTLACSLNTGSFGRLYDFFGGQADLEEGFIRILYKLSFLDEPQRLLRAVRFEQRFRFKIDEETLHSLSKARANKVISRLSKGQLYQEARLIFAEPSPLAVLSRLAELDFWQELFPRLSFSPGLIQTLQDLEKVLQHEESPLSFHRKRRNCFVLYLTVLTWETAEPDLKYLFYLMRLRKKERHKIMLLRTRVPGILQMLKEGSFTQEALNHQLDDLPEEVFPLLYLSGQEARMSQAIYQYRLTRKEKSTLSSG